MHGSCSSQKKRRAFLPRDAAMLAASRVLCDKNEEYTADILMSHERAITSLLTPKGLAGDISFHLKFTLKVAHPFENRRLRQISAYNVSAVRANEECSIVTKTKSTTGFATSYK